MAGLDLGLVRTFVAVADVGSFTAAAALSGTTQSAISMRIKKLEDRLGRRLFARTPRSMALTPFAQSFLPDARALLDHHDGLLRRIDGRARIDTLALGITDHFADADLPDLMAALKNAFPGLGLRVGIDASETLEAAFARGNHDAIVVRTDAPRAKDRLLCRDRLVWVASETLMSSVEAWRAGEPIPLASLARPCRLHDLAREALKAGGFTWTDALVGGGLQAVQAAVRAGLGVACLDRCNRPRGCRVLGPKSGLPVLPDSLFVARFRQDRPELLPVIDALAAVLAPRA